ncbi:FkbM family methyltransferase [Desulfitobacterium hafniense]|uniref:Methyltransferase FkbM domain-containing protein n=1 Tax=Desulfitobacterium hafniense (strain Y51) TaxID=138119 RepID=Q24T40_DESHY|nr:FkbM family methyltransferase [Desulfitobacterium hafniense]BAE84802.1 hypothetical protein DSY3013 [Desulfitobacterium hafniense Y51]
MLSKEQIEMARSFFHDSASRAVFEKRVEYAAKGNFLALLDMVGQAMSNNGDSSFGANLKLLALAKQVHTTQDIATIILWGSGAGSQTPIQLLHEYGLTTSGKVDIMFCDNNAKLWGTLRQHHNPHMRLPIISPMQAQAFAKKRSCRVIITVNSLHSQKSIVSQLTSYGFSDEQIICSPEFYEYFLGRMYFDPDIMIPHQHEMFVDVGAYDMGNTLDFIQWCNKDYAKVIALEADAVSFENCRKVVDTYHLENVDIYQKALYKCDCNISFESAPDGEFGGSRIHADGVVSVPAVALDSFLKIHPVDDVTLIKMDIEGAEEDALSGAQETIRKYKPRLAISVYHKPWDVVDIPLQISGIRPDYRFYLRHHTCGIYDTVLYAI